MLEIDGSQYSGSGAIVRQAVAFAALTGTAIHIYNVRFKRPKPGLHLQHAQAVEAIRQLVNGRTQGAVAGAREFVFRPGKPTRNEKFSWDIGSAGSTTALALAVLPVLAFSSLPVAIELRGGLFEDFAPSFYHLADVLLPLLYRMGVEASAQMERPGYVPTGGGIWRLAVAPTRGTLRQLLLDTPGIVAKVWGIALSSRLKEQLVSDRMAESAKRALEAAGYHADVEVIYDTSALQAGAVLAIFADLSSGANWLRPSRRAGPALRNYRNKGRAPALGRFKNRRNPRSLCQRPDHTVRRVGRRRKSTSHPASIRAYREQRVVESGVFSALMSGLMDMNW